jgi:hypothetical protein
MMLPPHPSPRENPLLLLLLLASSLLLDWQGCCARAQFGGFGHVPDGSFCGSVESGEGPLHLNLTFTSPCRMSLAGGSTASGDCSSEVYKFDSDKCFSKIPSWENCTVALPNLKNGSDCFKMQGIREITFDMCTDSCNGPPQATIYAFTGTAYTATLKPCGASPDRYLMLVRLTCPAHRLRQRVDAVQLGTMTRPLCRYRMALSARSKAPTQSIAGLRSRSSAGPPNRRGHTRACSAPAPTRWS